jgi:hypothetical protein
MMTMTIIKKMMNITIQKNILMMIVDCLKNSENGASTILKNQEETQTTSKLATPRAEHEIQHF